MGQHRAFGTASGAGRVEYRREIVARTRNGLEVGGRRGELLGESAIMRRTEALHGGEAEFSGKRANRLQRIGPADGQRRLGVTEKILKLGERIRRIERQERGARAQAREQKHDDVGRLVDLDGDPAAGLDAERDERFGRARGAFEEGAVG